MIAQMSPRAPIKIEIESLSFKLGSLEVKLKYRKCIGSSVLVDNVALIGNQRLHEGVSLPNKHESSRVFEVLTPHSRHESRGVEEVLTPDSRTIAGQLQHPHRSPNRLVFNAVSEPLLNN